MSRLGSKKLARQAAVERERWIKGEPWPEESDFQLLAYSGRAALLGPDNVVYKVARKGNLQQGWEIDFFRAGAKLGIVWIPPITVWNASNPPVIAMQRYMQPWKHGPTAFSIDRHEYETYARMPENKRRRAEMSEFRISDSGSTNVGLDENGFFVLLDGGLESSNKLRRSQATERAA